MKALSASAVGGCKKKKRSEVKKARQRMLTAQHKDARAKALKLWVSKRRAARMARPEAAGQSFARNEALRRTAKVRGITITELKEAAK